MLGQSHLVLTDFLMLLRATHFDHSSMWGPVASLALGVVFRKMKDRLRKALIVVNSSTTGGVANLAFGVVPLDVTDLSRAATYEQDQDRQLVVVCMGLSSVADERVLGLLLLPLACTDILLLQH